MTTIIFDDGEFLIDMNQGEHVILAIDGNSAASPGAGFLHHRCPLDPLATLGFERVGEYSPRDGKWGASINTRDSKLAPSGDPKKPFFRIGYVPNLGVFINRMDAITALWKARRSAHLLHD